MHSLLQPRYLFGCTSIVHTVPTRAVRESERERERESDKTVNQSGGRPGQARAGQSTRASHEMRVTIIASAATRASIAQGGHFARPFLRSARLSAAPRSNEAERWKAAHQATGRMRSPPQVAASPPPSLISPLSRPLGDPPGNRRPATSLQFPTYFMVFCHHCVLTGFGTSSRKANQWTIVPDKPAFAKTRCSSLGLACRPEYLSPTVTERCTFDTVLAFSGESWWVVQCLGNLFCPKCSYMVFQNVLYNGKGSDIPAFLL